MKMKYFRHAIKEDFEGFEIEHDNQLYLDAEIEKLIKTGKLMKAAAIINEKTGVGIKKAIGFCEDYSKYLQAKSDFEMGKDVFVPY